MNNEKYFELIDKPETKRHIELIRAFVNFAERDKSIRAVGVGGSFARGDADRWSDVDLYPIIEHMLSVPDILLQVEEWSRSMGDSITSCNRGYKFAFGLVIQVVFPPLVKIDFNINDLNSLQSNQMWRNRRALLDKEGHFNDFLANQRSYWTDAEVKSDLKKQLPQLQKMFWIEYAKAYKCVQKKDLWSAVFYLQRLREILFSTIRAYHEIPSLNPDRPYKGAEIQMGDIVKTEDLFQTLPSYSLGGISSALLSCVRAFDRYPCESTEACQLKEATLQIIPPQSLVQEY
jgi:hypothetical protein